MHGTAQKLLSYLWDLKISSRVSVLNDKLEVWYAAGKYRLDSGKANYSFGALHRLFQKVFREIDLGGRNPENMLLLGLGAGSVVSILRDELKMTTKITGVEHDDTVIRLAKEYFAIDRYPGLSVVHEDAAVFVAKNDQNFDCMVIDLFIDRDVPEKFIQPAFLADCFRHLTPKGILIFNFITSNIRQKEEFEELKRNITVLGKEFRVLEPFDSNKVIVAG
jgi:spermidine synthase